MYNNLMFINNTQYVVFKASTKCFLKSCAFFSIKLFLFEKCFCAFFDENVLIFLKLAYLKIHCLVVKIAFSSDEDIIFLKKNTNLIILLIPNQSKAGYPTTIVLTH